MYSFPRLEWPKTEDPFSRPFVGQNWFRLVLLNRINTADVIGYFFFTNRALFLCPTYTHPIRSFQGMPNSKEIWIAPMRNPIWPLWTKSCMGHCKLVKTVKSECERQKQAPHSILCAHTVLGHWSEYIFTNKRPAGNALEGADGVCICGAKEKYPVGQKKVAYYIRGVYTVQEH